MSNMIKNDKEFYTDIQDYAEKHRVPIIPQESVEWLDSFLCDKEIHNILEIGGAIGYSSLCFHKMTGANVVSVERDDERFEQAVQNLAQYDHSDAITFLHADATGEEFFELAKENAPYDLLFIDATKRENKLFFENFKQFVKTGGYIITDNINFHDLTGTEEEIMKLHRRIRPLVRSIVAYREWLPTLSDFETTFIEVGDTLAVSKKIK